MNRHFNIYIPAAIAICIAVSAAAALLLLGPAQAFGATSPDTSDDGSVVPRMAASYVQRKLIAKAKQSVAPTCQCVYIHRLDLNQTKD